MLSWKATANELRRMVGDAVLSRLQAVTWVNRSAHLKCLETVSMKCGVTAKPLPSSTGPSRSAAKIPTVDSPTWRMKARDGHSRGEGQFDEARRALDYALTNARQTKSTAISLRFLSKRVNSRSASAIVKKPIEYLEQGGDLARKHAFFGWRLRQCFDLARIYRDAGDLQSAEEPRRHRSGLSAERSVTATTCHAI